MKRIIFSRLRMMFSGIAAGTLAFVWWGVLYPELCFPQDVYEVICTPDEENMSEDDMYRQLLWADEEQIVIESRLLEWIKKRSLNVK